MVLEMIPGVVAAAEMVEKAMGVTVEVVVMAEIVAGVVPAAGMVIKGG